jgi:Protein of unknown function (DUF3575)
MSAASRFGAVAVVLALTAAPAFAHREGRGEWDDYGEDMLLVNPGDLFSGVLSVQYEHAFSRHFGLTAGLSVWAFRGVFSPPSDPWFTGISPEFGMRFHFIQHAPAGLWLGPTLNGGVLFTRSDGTLTRAFAWGVGAAIGYTFVIGRHFALELGIGGGFLDTGDSLRWAPRLRLGLGGVF